MIEILKELGYSVLAAADAVLAVPLLRSDRRHQPAHHGRRPARHQRPPARRDRARSTGRTCACSSSPAMPRRPPCARSSWASGMDMIAKPFAIDALRREGTRDDRKPRHASRRRSVTRAAARRTHGCTVPHAVDLLSLRAIVRRAVPRCPPPEMPMVQKSGTSRPLVIAAVMASMFMVAIEATIVSTAMPQIVGELGGLDLYSWVFAAFLLTQTAMTVVFGKLSDLYGRKPIMLAGIAVFLVASVLAGFAWSMPSMIVFRLFQGVGAGAMQPVAMTIVGDLFPGRRARQGAGLPRQRLGALRRDRAARGRADHPLAAAGPGSSGSTCPSASPPPRSSCCSCARPSSRRSARSTMPARCCSSWRIAALMLALTEAGQRQRRRSRRRPRPRSSSVSVLFVWQERRAPDPMVSFALWRRRPIAAANAATLLASMARDGADHLPADVHPGRAPSLAGGRGLHADHDGAGLADRRDARRAHLPRLRAAAADDRGQPARAPRRDGVRAAGSRELARCWRERARW